MEHFVEFFFFHKAQFQDGFFQGNVVLEGQFGHLGTFVVADIGAQGRHQHQGIVQVVGHFFPCWP